MRGARRVSSTAPQPGLRASAAWALGHRISSVSRLGLGAARADSGVSDVGRTRFRDLECGFRPRAW